VADLLRRVLYIVGASGWIVIVAAGIGLGYHTLLVTWLVVAALPWAALWSFGVRAARVVMRTEIGLLLLFFAISMWAGLRPEPLGNPDNDGPVRFMVMVAGTLVGLFGALVAWVSGLFATGDWAARAVAAGAIV
jgi:hypothetical protein